jgi:hypothetical protein
MNEASLVDLLDRLLAGGVVLSGHLTLTIADVDLVRIDLNALITSVTTCQNETLPPSRADASPWTATPSNAT